MLFRTLNSSSLAVAIIAPFLVLALWSRFFFFDINLPTALTATTMPLWEALVMPWFGYSRYAAASGAFLLALATGLTINKITSGYGLTQSTNTLPLIVFALLTSAILHVQKLNPVWLFALFLVLATSRLFAAATSKSTIARCFDAGFLIGIGSLFYAKGIFFFPVLIIGMGILRITSLSALASSFTGLLLPFAMSFTYYFFFDQGGWFWGEVYQNLLFNPGEYNHTSLSRVYIAIIIGLLGASLLSTIRYMPVQKIATRQYFRVFIWMILWITVAVLTPFFSMEMVPLASIGATVTICFWLENLRSNWLRELLFCLLALVTILGQIFLA